MRPCLFRTYAWLLCAEDERPPTATFLKEHSATSSVLGKRSVYTTVHSTIEGRRRGTCRRNNHQPFSARSARKSPSAPLFARKPTDGIRAAPPPVPIARNTL